MRSGQIDEATVTSTNPLMVRETVNSEPVPAHRLSGSTYTPTTVSPGSRVLVTFVRGRYYILGGANG